MSWTRIIKGDCKVSKLFSMFYTPFHPKLRVGVFISGMSQINACLGVYGTKKEKRKLYKDRREEKRNERIEILSLSFGS